MRREVAEVVFPNEWQKPKRTRAAAIASAKGEAYRQYFQPLIDELREKHKFTGARIAQPQSWYSFSSGVANASFGAAFSNNNRARVEVYIDYGDFETNKALFDWLHARKKAIEEQCGFSIQWDRLDEKQASRISVDRSGNLFTLTLDADAWTRLLTGGLAAGIIMLPTTA